MKENRKPAPAQKEAEARNTRSVPQPATAAGAGRSARVARASPAPAIPTPAAAQKKTSALPKTAVRAASPPPAPGRPGIGPHRREEWLLRIQLGAAALAWLVLAFCTWGLALVVLALVWGGWFLGQALCLAFLRGCAVQISAQQFADLHDRVRMACRSVALERAPQAWLLAWHPRFDTVASRFVGRDHLVLHASITDALDKQHPDALDFYIGHELAKNACGYHRFLRQGFLLPVCWLPLLGSACRRAQQYTCDRYGRICCKNTGDAEIALAALCAGTSRALALNRDDLIAQAQQGNRFGASLAELLSNTPWLTRRMQAVRAASDDGATAPHHPLAQALGCLIPRLHYIGTSAASLANVVLLGLVLLVVVNVAIPVLEHRAERSRMEQVAQQESAIRQRAQQLAQQVHAELVQKFTTAEAMRNTLYAGDYFRETSERHPGQVTVEIEDNGTVSVSAHSNLARPEQKEMLYSFSADILSEAEVRWNCRASASQAETPAWCTATPKTVP